jgi:S-adenosylmethionine:tRNA ribosyltransferase-isomerase
MRIEEYRSCHCGLSSAILTIMKILDFDYPLPSELIAQEPSLPRGNSRLMVVRRERGTIEHRHFSELPSLLPPKCLLVLNDSRVIPARLFCRKIGTGGKVEILLTRRLHEKRWEALVRPGRRLPPGTMLVQEKGSLQIAIRERTPYGTRIVELFYEGDFWELLGHCGETPLPPYIKRALSDLSRYQTIYADERGSVAAPTAGLHFTDAIFDELHRRSIEHAFITLHVGPGTFRPVKVENIEEHIMEREFFSLSPDAAAKIGEAKLAKKKIIAVGTTSVRTLEAAVSGGNPLMAGSGDTDLFIYPGFRFSLVHGMVTNFHLPRSTLFLLVCAMAGTDLMQKAYKEAIKEKYRFYSLGDAMLIL